MAQQTAVEWLVNEISYQLGTNDLLEGLYEHAKLLEMQQIIDAYDKGESNDGMNKTAEQYYNETYKQ